MLHTCQVAPDETLRYNVSPLLTSTILLNYPFMLALIFFFCFSILGPKNSIFYPTALMLSSKEKGAWHCGRFMQILVKLALLQDSKSTAK